MSQSKYANGNPIQIDELSEVEKKQAIDEWSEGNPELKKLLELCEENGIKTWSSCSGHNAEKGEEAKNASISMILEYGNSDKVLKLLAKMDKDKNIEFGIGIINDSTVPCYVTIYSPEKKYNEKFFKQINHELNEIDKDNSISHSKLEKYKSLKGIAEKESDYNGRSVEIFQDDTSDIRVVLWDEEVITFMQYISEEGAITYNESLDDYVRAKELTIQSLPDEPYLTLATINQDINEVKKKVRRSRTPISAIENVFKKIKNGLIKQKKESKGEIVDGSR